MCGPRRKLANGPSACKVSYYLFDVIWCDGYDVRALDLRSRKTILRAAIDFGEPLRFSTHRNGSGEAYYAYACAHGWEGLVAKRASSPYVGRRSPDWLKFKCEAEQELVIGGFTEPQGSRVGFGALLLGYYEGGELRYAGKVGTGYDTNTLVSLRRALDRIERATPAFTEPVRERDAHWVEPSSSRKSGSRNGRPTASCATPSTSGCATTRRRPTWSASAPS